MDGALVFGDGDIVYVLKYSDAQKAKDEVGAANTEGKAFAWGRFAIGGPNEKKIDAIEKALGGASYR